MTEKTTTTPAAIEPEDIYRPGRATEEVDAEGHAMRAKGYTEDAPEAEGVAKATEDDTDTEGHEKK